jgi:SsrA-binding protein
MSRGRPEKAREKAAAARPVATNRKAFHDYFIEDRAEAGLVLTGTEVKSLREGRAQLKDAMSSSARERPS